jgi:hypothetical protein
MTSVVASALVLLAHHGGWHDMVLVLVPILVIAALLARAKRRADRLYAERTPPDTERPQGPPPS